MKQNITNKMDQCSIIERNYTTKSGSTVIKRYQKRKFLGKGSFSRCYEIYDPDKQKLLAGKVIDKASLDKNEAKEKLLNEVRIHQLMSHPNIVRFEEYFEDSSKAYLLIELCSNNSLKAMIKQRHKLKEIEAQYFLVQLVYAVKYIHSQNVIHRDLKLENLFLSNDMQLKVGDFGLATKLSFAEEKKRSVCGTPKYMAPEVIASKARGYTLIADIWSIGVILYTMLLGETPFESDNIERTYRRISIGMYSYPKDSNISPEAKNLISQILKIYPSKRISLEDILNHSFVTKTAIPQRLPEAALESSISYDQLTFDEKESIEYEEQIIEMEAKTPENSTPTKVSDEIYTNKHLTSFNTISKKIPLINKKALKKEEQIPYKEQRLETDSMTYIKHYKDYTKNYGIGYLLTNGVIGFYFNDMTSLALFNKEQYAYYDLYSSAGISYVKKETMGKKDKILDQFKSHCKRIGESNNILDSEEVLVRQVTKTKDGILFQLSNDVVQMVFLDGAQLIFNLKIKLLIHIDKLGAKRKMTITNALNSDKTLTQSFKCALNLLDYLNTNTELLILQCTKRRNLMIQEVSN